MQQGMVTSTLPIEVELQHRASTLTVTSFTAIGKDDVNEKSIKEQLEQLNKIDKDGFYTYSYNGLQYLIKYVQRLILYDVTRKNSAIQVAVDNGIIHLRAAAFSIIGGKSNNE